MADRTNVPVTDAYCDGGVIGCNPSVSGGTWAFVHVCAGGEILRKESGVVIPESTGLPVVTNNYTELYAAVLAMEALPVGWAGHLYTDSHVTMCRLVNARPSFKGIPDDFRDRVFAARKRMGQGWRVVLLDGHPTKAQLMTGIGKRGNPCSRFNVMCDDLCRSAGLNFAAGLLA